MSIDRYRLNWAASAALRKQAADARRRSALLTALAALFVVAFLLGYIDGLNELALAAQERAAP